jgi:hypothetical protein
VIGMDYKIGDTVKISVYVTEKWGRLVPCKITNKYIRNNTTYYSLQEINGIYRVSNVKENRFILD